MRQKFLTSYLLVLSNNVIKIGTRSVHVGSREKIGEFRTKNQGNAFLMPYKACFPLGDIVCAARSENKDWLKLTDWRKRIAANNELFPLLSLFVRTKLPSGKYALLVVEYLSHRKIASFCAISLLKGVARLFRIVCQHHFFIHLRKDIY